MKDFKIVYEKYFKDVYKYAFTLCKNESFAEEITQETFFKALRNIDKFDGSGKLFVWLCQIAKNYYFTHYQKNKRKTAFYENFEVEDPRDFETLFLDQETAYEIHIALHNLEEPYKEVFSLRVFGELSFKQISELFGKTESWARVTYHRAKIKIQEELS